jgi:hypothetical protein
VTVERTFGLRRGEQFHGLGTADEADVVDIPGPDDDCVVRRRSSTFIPQKCKRQTGPISKLLKSLALPTGIEPVFQA